MKLKIEQIEDQLIGIVEDEQTDPLARYRALVDVSVILEELMMDLEQAYDIDPAHGYEDEDDDMDDDFDDDDMDDDDMDDDFDDLDSQFDHDW